MTLPFNFLLGAGIWAQIPAPNKKLKGKVIDVIEKGFKLGDRIIRHPKVVVGN